MVVAEQENKRLVDMYCMSMSIHAKMHAGLLCSPASAGKGPREQHVPTLTEVLPSSSDARLPPAPTLLLMLMRLVVLAGRTRALMGRDGMPAGDPGGELAMRNGEAAASLRPDVELGQGSRCASPKVRRGFQ